MNMKHRYHVIPGWFNYHEAYDLAIEQLPQDAKVLEIGCFMGKSTSYLLTNLWNADRQDVVVHALDTFTGSSEHGFLNRVVGPGGSFKHITHENLRFFVNRELCQLVEGSSADQEIIDKYKDGYFDMIMVDGAHEYEAVCDDIDNWWPKLKDGGVMLFDDMYMPSVATAAQHRLADKVPDYMVMQGKEHTGLALKGSDQSKRMNWVKIIPEEHFRYGYKDDKKDA